MTKNKNGFCSRFKWLHFILLVSILSLPSFGDTEQPCYPDCFDDEFGGVMYHTMTLPNGCEILVSYATRFACRQWFDVMIYRVVRTKPGDPLCDFLDNLSIGEVLELATQQLLLENPMGFPPINRGDCEPNWRVIKGNCWSKLEIPFNPTNPSTHYYPCKEPNLCCLQPYTVCIDDFGERTVQSGGSNPLGDCDTATPPVNGGPCEPVCGRPWIR